MSEKNEREKGKERKKERGHAALSSYDIVVCVS